MSAEVKTPLIVLVVLLMLTFLAVFPGSTAADKDTGGTTAAEMKAELNEEIYLLENKASECLEKGDFDTPRQYFQQKENFKYEIAVLEESERIKLIRP